MLKEINSDKKIEILIEALNERYDSVHKIRERVENTGFWILGIMVGIGAWLLQTDVIFGFVEKIIFIISIIFALLILRFRYLQDLNTGFKSQQRIVAKLEKTLGFFTPGFFDDTEIVMYPKEWEKAGTEDGDGKFFETTYLLIYFGVIYLILLIVLNGYCV